MGTIAHMSDDRKTADRPHRKPFLLVLVRVSLAAVAALGVIYVSTGWIRSFAIVTLLLALVYVETRQHRTQDPTSRQIRISSPHIAIVNFADGMPVPLRALRAAFFLLAAAMVLFGISPLTERTAKTGMIVSVLGLVTIGFLNAVLERHYVHTGRGQDVAIGSLPLEGHRSSDPKGPGQLATHRDHSC
jgi:hypothetical protein